MRLSSSAGAAAGGVGCRPACQVLVALVSAAGFGLTACSSISTEVGRPLPEDQPGLVEGKTRMSTVLRELGPPHAVSALPDGCAFLYEHSKVDELQFGISLDSIDAPYLKLITANSKLSETAHLLTFDEDGVLRANHLKSWEEKLSGGQALQFVTSVSSLTDITTFQQIPEPLVWGRGRLQPLPVTLNAGQDLGTGEHGVEQRLSPRYAGQATLEMAPPKAVKINSRKSRR